MSFSKCREELYIDTSEFNSILYHSFSVIDIPLNMFVIYLIIYKSSKKLKNIKSPLLTLQIWSTVSDLMLGTLLVPYVAFPIIGYRPTGLLHYLPVSPVIQTHFTIIFIAEVGASVAFVFENRNYYLVRKHHSRFTSLIRKLFFVGNIVAPFITEFILYLDTPEHTNVEAYILENIDCPSRDLLSSPIVVISKSRNLAAFLLTIDLAFYICQIAFYNFRSTLFLRKSMQDTSISARTRILRKKFYYAVCIQTLVPFVNIVVPASCCAITIYLSYYNQALNNFCIFAISTHGLVGSIAIILAYKEYRSFVCQLLFRGKVSSTNDVQVPVEAERDSAHKIAIYN